MTVHEMAASLRLSRAHVDSPWWEQVYRQAFPTLQGTVNIRDNGSGQRDGIDRHLILANGRTVTVDEKVRKEDWPDFCLEYWSVKHKYGGRDDPGWVAKDKRCDYVAYAFIPSQRCYLLPFPTLRRAWRENRYEWVERYRRVEADNGHYWTISVAVPIEVCLAALSDAMLIHWEASE